MKKKPERPPQPNAETPEPPARRPRPAGPSQNGVVS
jgi:hypothetical protein